ncbi:Fic/DOC family protein [Desulfovibrio psychrotolerans]|uniref:protein adenylyltransferase n=1 Tax=Desulfovibrio psychrotolerans TaxID=415242 RepID=A0A7J0BT85_9BACT|nr:Fic family protein [Desulfovibrio psychrotolerans]GFM36214.1 putative adenosine monophosphate-protein transferase y4lH [Desulfovibrio psychrotolerans]
MTDRYAHRDGYTYPDSPVLRNKAGHTDQGALDKFERLSVTNRMVEDPPAGNFDYLHLKAIHHHLFQDVYDWAGEERNVSISKGQTRFATPCFINQAVTELFNRLANEDHLRTAPPELFVERAAYYALELNVAHPFREGNGRAIRYFLSLLAQNADYEIDEEVLKGGWLEACTKGMLDDGLLMRNVLAHALIILED